MSDFSTVLSFDMRAPAFGAPSAELYEEALESGATAARERWLRRLRESLTEHGRPPLQVLEQPLALTAYLQVGEATDDDKGGEPDGSDESSRNAHAAPRWPAA